MLMLADLSHPAELDEALVVETAAMQRQIRSAHAAYVDVDQAYRDCHERKLNSFAPRCMNLVKRPVHVGE